ncbi:MAG: DUF177 domain-containing protein [Candidatus Omnitrophica bacterium]|nr:DUF177 domain-containing protein [Candidatus Omnitrophota bacterium]MDD5352709.1 DUF177 domain-containing protein [Candidatus Omnitrophota bacterium]MDD5550308.1 DUF177 domain-containing protein [Candidatus Omnitrophota bacterium]
MKIDVLRLKEDKTEHFQESLTPAEFDLDNSEVKYKGNICLSTDATKEKQMLFTKTHFTATAEFICSRCLKEYVSKIERDFNIDYPLVEAGQFIDVTKNIREEIILDYPIKFLCKPDCRGLCPKCGKDLNKEKCNCQMKTQFTE